MPSQKRKKIVEQKHDFSKPTETNTADQCFGCDTNKLLPAYTDIPAEFKNSDNKWHNFVNKWFFNGLSKDIVFSTKDGIDAKVAFLHVQACLKSWQPKHEHKTAGCAYLLNLWFNDVLENGKSVF